MSIEQITSTIKPAPTKPTVLVVEDEMLLRMRAVDMVEDAGFTALEAVNADDALTLLACPIHQGSSNFEVWRSFLPLAATIRGAARGAHLDFIFSG